VTLSERLEGVARHPLVGLSKLLSPQRGGLDAVRGIYGVDDVRLRVVMALSRDQDQIDVRGHGHVGRPPETPEGNLGDLPIVIRKG
jgi:hypothetical protein